MMHWNSDQTVKALFSAWPSNAGPDAQSYASNLRFDGLALFKRSAGGHQRWCWLGIMAMKMAWPLPVDRDDVPGFTQIDSGSTCREKRNHRHDVQRRDQPFDERCTVSGRSMGRWSHTGRQRLPLMAMCSAISERNSNTRAGWQAVSDIGRLFMVSSHDPTTCGFRQKRNQAEDAQEKLFAGTDADSAQNSVTAGSWAND